ncbi:MAG: aminotransferase class V-fold PLP-dependent enzyme [Sulfitobacter sp.]
MTDFESPESYWSWHEKHGYDRFINVSGTMTGLGGSIVKKEIRDETAAAMGRFVKINDLQLHASRMIAELTGAEAGCITASASAGITVSVAACMTGLDPVMVERLPRRPGEKREVAVQLGHLCGYGAPVSTGIELAGATVRQVGQSTIAMDHQLEGALTENTAAALYVVSHHVVHYGQIPFERFVKIAHAKGVPVIVDAASEYNLTGFIEGGADIVIYSGQKFLGGPTAGIIAGQHDLVRAAYLQNIGIARGMKVGKESIAGVIAAMNVWMKRDHAAIRKAEIAHLDLWKDAVSGIPGIVARKVDDPTGNPLERLQIDIDPKAAGASAATFARALGRREPAIIVRNHEVELGYFQLDPCNVAPGQAQLVGEALRETLKTGPSLTPDDDDFALARNGGVESYLHWTE